MRHHTARLSLVLLLCLALAAPAAGQSAGDQTPRPEQQEPTFRFDFRDAELRLLVEFMANLYGLIPIVPDELLGRASVASPAPMTTGEAYRVVSTLLDTRGFTMVRDATFLRVVPKLDSLSMPLAINYGASVADVPLEDAVLTQVIPLENMRADTLQLSLQPLVSPTGNLFISPDTNMLVITDTATNIRRLMELIDYLDVRRAVARTEETVVYHLDYMNAEEIATALDTVFGLAAGLLPDDAAKITPVAAANALVITADLDTHRRIATTIEGLDTRRRQVLIEVRIVEGTTSEEFRFGMNLLGFLTDEQTVSIGNPRQINNIATPGSFAASQFFTYTLNTANLDIKLEAAAQDDLISILSAPRVLTSDNEEAQIIVANREPIVRSSTQVDTSNNLVTDFTYEDIGIDLTVTPRINLDRDVALDVHFSISNVLAEVQLGSTQAPRIGKRESSTNVTVADGSTLVIGGLRRDVMVDQRTKVPVLGDIPGLGLLFRKTEKRKEQTELLVFITPRVAFNDEEGRALTQEELDAMGEELRGIERRGRREQGQQGEQPESGQVPR